MRLHSRPREPGYPSPTMQSTPNVGPLKQRFLVTAPRATAIKLVGDFTRWHENPLFLQQGEDGTWGVEVELAPGAYHFRFIVDQEPDTGSDDVVEVPGPEGRPQTVQRSL